MVFLLHEHDNRLNNAVCAKTTSAVHSQEISLFSFFFTHAFQKSTAVLPCILGHACGTYRGRGLESQKG